MATITPVAYGPGKSIVGTTQVGDLTVGTSPQDYGVVGTNNGLVFYSTPNEDLGYVIAHTDPLASHNGLPGNVPASVGFWRSPLLTEESFVEFTNELFDQSFTGGTQAKNWLNTNGYWTSYRDVYRFNSLATLSWPVSSVGYTLYNGGFNSVDDGNSNSPITLPVAFETNNQSSTSLFLSTNGYFTLTTGSGTIISSPQGLSNPAAMCGNPGDNWMQPGLTLNDGDVQNWWYQTGTSGGKSYVKNLVYCGQFQATTTPQSYLINFYRDEQFEWLETRVKSNTRGGNAGPYNVIDVSQGASTTSRVWRGDLNGQNWVYLGTGTVIE
jgi:hypothetical protein